MGRVSPPRRRRLGFGFRAPPPHQVGAINSASAAAAAAATTRASAAATSATSAPSHRVHASSRCDPSTDLVVHASSRCGLGVGRLKLLPPDLT